MSGSTAQHIPGGCCFVFNGKDDLSSWSDREVDYDLTGVTASLLHVLDADVPDYMPEPIKPLVGALRNSDVHPAGNASAASSHDTAHGGTSASGNTALKNGPAVQQQNLATSK